MKEDVSRFVRYAVNVMGVANDFTDPEGLPGKASRPWSVSIEPLACPLISMS